MSDLHREALVIDLHAHAPGFVPQPFAAAYHAVTPRRPRADQLTVLRDAGVDAIVLKAVGDPVVTRWHLGKPPWEAVEAQLAMAESQALAAGAVLARTVEDIDRARSAGSPAVLLGVEGADALGREVDRVDEWAARGVRVVVPVHLGDNQFGRTCMPWQEYAGPLKKRRRAEPGLTDLGRSLVERLNAAGIVVDVAHADSETLRDIVAVSNAPVVSSHSGARALQDFPRYLRDDELRLIASTDGVVGLWPYKYGRRGTATVNDIVDHARYIASVIGPEHLCIGTDMNGVPGVAQGYRGERDLPIVTQALLDGGFSADEVRGILGKNARRVLAAASSPASPAQPAQPDPP